MGSSHMTPLARITSGVVLAAVMAVSGGGMAAGAGSGGTTLRYRCAIPLLPEQPMTVRLTWNAPKSVAVGQKTPIVPFDAVATMGDAVTQGLAFIGAVTVEGSATATGVVAAPEGNTPVSLPLTVPRTPVPSAGSITVVASGRTPGLVFHRPGHASVTVGNEFAVRLVPRTADGGSTSFDASCTLEPGQNTVLTSFEITAPQANPAPTPGRPTGPAATTGGGGPSTPETPGTAPPTGPPTARSSSTAPSSEIPVTGDPSTPATHDTAFTAVSTAGLTKAAAPWLVAGAILVAGTVLGCCSGSGADTGAGGIIPAHCETRFRPRQLPWLSSACQVSRSISCW
ncbi:MAG: DUF6801 domain-containing protein [Actinophytocola sp.]|uniref:DUF6801 domain-containing protein n=1 Tax=Actinophytocola sp. TaxID=1872138 RepID=UPI003C73BEA5